MSDWNPRLYSRRIEVQDIEPLARGYEYEVYEESESDAGPISSQRTVRVPSIRECISVTIAEMEKMYGAAEYAKGVKS